MKMKIRRRTLMLLTLELLLVMAVVFGVNLWRTRESASGAAPEIAAITLDGEMVNLGDYSGENLLVYFWASWCPVCGFVDNSVDALAEDYPVITVALSSGSDAEIRQHLQEEGLSFDVVNDADGEISQRWGVVGVPMSFIIDRQGEIRFRDVGYSSGPGLRLRLWIAENFDEW
ncbi:protein disulfide oxidoreductase [Solemya elarraichensis gill symbiont]|uniref:Thioredoxin domain-containing protein n=1 Tax=Solemya elarraichensis gill symbiont TaxID=1918949 RepID=A0A1T2L3U6_9GAMM|nr:protein disulfide oxidoreductase [Solemya elarraichensis gill symbiont]OOZ39742.1 hypothetical protein BOW52_06880 [Solemya elarraichensis gill symbiont]